MNRTNPIGRLSPGITTVIRMDHTNVLASFHWYVSTRIDTAPASAAYTGRALTRRSLLLGSKLIGRARCAACSGERCR